MNLKSLIISRKCAIFKLLPYIWNEEVHNTQIYTFGNYIHVWGNFYLLCFDWYTYNNNTNNKQAKD